MPRYLTIFISVAIAIAAATAQTVGVYTAAQATAGRTAYQTNCASCHVENLSGRNEAPPLAGGTFMNAWRTRTTRDLFEYMQATMPPNQPSLAADQYLAITSFILQSNRMPAGSQPLTATTAVAIGTGAASAGRGRGTPPAADAPATASAPQRGQRGGAITALGPAGQTVFGEVKDYLPITDEMLRNQDPADWLMARRNYQGWSHSPLTQVTRDYVKDLQPERVLSMEDGGPTETGP